MRDRVTLSIQKERERDVRSAATMAAIALQDAENYAFGARGSTASMRSKLVYDLAEFKAMMLATEFMYLAAGGCNTDIPFNPRNAGDPGDAFAASVVLFDQALQHVLETLARAPDAASAEELRVLKALAHTNVEAVKAAASQDEGALVFASGHADFCIAARVLNALQ